MPETTELQVIPLCPGCAMRLYGQGIALVTVRGVLYHAACWVFRLAPSLRAVILTN